MIDPAISSLGSSIVETSINEALKYDPGTRIAISELSGKVIQINLEDKKISVIIHFIGEQIQLQITPNDYLGETDADLVLQGTTSDLIKLAQSNNHSLAKSGVRANGSIGLLEQLHTLTKHIDIDWEDALSTYLSPSIARPVSALVRQGTSFFKSALKSSSTQAAEYIKHESRLTTTKSEFTHFSKQVRALRQDTDRLTAKFDALLKKNNGHT